MRLPDPADRPGDHVSTGDLPPPGHVRRLVDEAHARFAGVADGTVSQVYPALARMPAGLFGICVVGTDASLHAVGDADHPFTIMSVSKPFVFALICDRIGPTGARERLGVNATGRAFNAVAAADGGDGRTNPMVNSGAIATTSLAEGADADARWRFIREGLSRFAGRELELNDEVHASAIATNSRNRGLAWLLESKGLLGCDPMQALDLYTRQCSLDVTARDLAVMGATLACGGFNPVTRDQVVAPEICHYALAVMITAGLYETSGDWLYEVGLPGKSGIGGGIVTVSPGKGGLATFAPPLDAAGNSVRGQLAARHLSHRLGLDLLASSPRR
ncbi:MAG: glutaminase A [Amaricoccus sp.]